MTIYKYTLQNENEIIRFGELISDIRFEEEILFDFNIITDNLSDICLEKLLIDNNFNYIKIELNI